MSFPFHEVYSRCLLGAHGYPLWAPQLKTQLRESYQLEGLKIGDVGVVSPNNGGFDVLFNITLPCDEQPYPELVREGFTPVTLDRERDFDTQPDAVSPHSVISSPAMELVSREVHNCDQQPSRADYEFNLSVEDGAVLILPEGAESCDLANERIFLGEAIRHGVNWYECATEAAGRLISNDSLYLITGVHKACSWSLGAAKRCGSSLQNLRPVKFSVGQVHQDCITAGAYLWAAAYGFTGRAGPMYPYEIPNYIRDERLRRGLNQTVFIRGFRITVNKILFLKTVSVKTRRRTFFGFGIDKPLWGRPTKHTPSSSTESATDNEVEQDFSGNDSRIYMDKHMTTNRVSDVSQSFHPGDSINHYLLQKEPRAMVAVTHDSLWIDMLRRGLLDLADFSLAKRLQEVLMDNYRVIVEDGKYSGAHFHCRHLIFTGAVYLQKGHSESSLSSSALTENSEHDFRVPQEMLSVDPPSPYQVPRTYTEPCNVIIFGETGVGKSSVVNLIAGDKLAKTSPDQSACTFASNPYHIVLQNNRPFCIWDTIGLNEPEISHENYLRAVKQAYKLVKELERSGGIHLLLLCMRGRITKSVQQNYRLFAKVLCERKVPLCVVVTNLENELCMEEWWSANERAFEQYGISADGHACITAIPGVGNIFLDRYEESRERIRRLLLDLSNEGWKKDTRTWLGKMTNMLPLRHRRAGHPTHQEIMEKLVKECGFSKRDATAIAASIGQIRDHTQPGDDDGLA